MAKRAAAAEKKKAARAKQGSPGKKKPAAAAKRPKKPRRQKPLLVVFDPVEQARERDRAPVGPRWFPWACQGRVAARSAAIRERLGPPLELLWEASLKAAPSAAPVAADDGAVYLGDRDGRLLVFELETGRPRPPLRTDPIREASPAWPLVAQRLVPPDRVPVSASPALHAWHLFFGDDEGIFYGVRRGENTVLWRKAAALSLAARQGGAYLAPLCAGELVVTLDQDGNLYAADGRSGRTAFALFLRGRPAAPPALAPWRDLVLAATRPLFPGESSRLHAVALDGERRWHQDLPFAPGPALLATQDLVLVGGEQGLLAFGTERGEPRWRAESPAVVGPAAIGPDRVLCPLLDGVGAWDLQGTLLWRTPADKRGHPIPLPGAGLLLAGDVVWGACARGLFALDAGSGELLHRERLPGDPAGGAVAAGERLLVATSGRVLRAYRATPG